VERLALRSTPISKLPEPELLRPLPDNLSLIVSLSAAIPLLNRKNADHEVALEKKHMPI
jgi:hypothetical protein